MRMRPPAERGHTGVLVLVAAALTVLLVTAGSQGATRATTAAPAVSWQGLVGSPTRPRVTVGQRMFVVLKTPSLADRVAAAGGRATDKEERGWTAQSLSDQRLLISRLAVQGVRVQPTFSFARVLSGFSAALDARAVALLQRDDSVRGIYPVRVAYPATVSSSLVDRHDLTDSLGRMPGLALPGYDGRGVTIALLDTGVERTHPFLRGHVAEGIDVVDPARNALPAANPAAPADLERHGTELAGILVGSAGPPALSGVAPGATVLPIRVAGWQRGAGGRYGVFARTDQVVAGLERAVDPNADGDAHDAARIALVGVAAPFAAFADDASARAVAGAARLDTLVVAPAGNDGPAGPGFGSISGPGGADATLTVGAVDTRARAEQVHVTLRSGLDVVLDANTPLVNAPAVAHPVTARIAAPFFRRPRASFEDVRSFFSSRGLSLVAGRVALIPAGSAPAVVAANAERAGAVAVVLYGDRLPAGGIGLDGSSTVPVVSVPRGVAVRVLNAVARGADAGASIGGVATIANGEGGAVTSFSSTGLAYDGRVKPDIVAPGVGIGTSDVGVAADGTASYATVNGSSAAAAAVAGGAAVLAQARPSLRAGELHAALVGDAQQLAGENVLSEGAGYVSLGAAAASELAAEPATLALGNARTARWRRQRTILVRNTSTRSVNVGVRIERQSEGAAAIRFSASPSRARLAPGASVRVNLSVRAASAPVGTAPAVGNVLLRVAGGTPVRVPWVVTFAVPPDTLLGPLHLSSNVFKPSDASPALLTFQAGRILDVGGRAQVQPVSVLALQLLRGDGTDLGVLVRLRDLLPGQYAFGLTGRSPAGSVLGRGNYLVRVLAYPSLPGPPSRKQVTFHVK